MRGAHAVDIVADFRAVDAENAEKESAEMASHGTRRLNGPVRHCRCACAFLFCERNKPSVTHWTRETGTVRQKLKGPTS
jgi:hypothetical protein